MNLFDELGRHPPVLSTFLKEFFVLFLNQVLRVGKVLPPSPKPSKFFSETGNERFDWFYESVFQ